MHSAAAGSAILVLAGVNGAGKSSFGGEFFRKYNAQYFNPDEIARRIRETSGCSLDEANAMAWQEGRQRLELAIETRSTFAFETTLGGKTIPRLLEEASVTGIPVRVWFVGLSTPEQHIARVRARVAAGGHDIPKEMILKRWDHSRRNLIALMPFLTELRIFDNSQEYDPSTGKFPEINQLLYWRDGAIVDPPSELLLMTPEWAKPIVAQALKLQRRS